MTENSKQMKYGFISYFQGFVYVCVCVFLHLYYCLCGLMYQTAVVRNLLLCKDVSQLQRVVSEAVFRLEEGLGFGIYF